VRDVAEAATANDEWVVAASYGQERLWFVDQIEPNSPAFNIITSVHLPYALTVAEIGTALGGVVARHEALRTSLRAVDGEPRQVVHATMPIEVRQVDLRGRDPAELDALLGAHAVQPIPLDAPPLWRATAVRLDEAQWRLVFVAHHAIFDGTSIPNLRTELTELCRAALDGRPADLPELPIQYADFAAWQRDQLSGDTLAAHLEHWRSELSGAPYLHGLPTDRPRPARGPATGADLAVDLPHGLAAEVAGVARRLRATPFMVYLAGYAALVHRLSGDDEVLFGVPVGGRELPEVLPLIGMFVNTIVVRVDLSGEPTFADLVERVRVRMHACWEYQDTPFQQVVAAVVARRESGVPALYQLGFNYLPDIGTGTGNGVARDDLMLGVTDRYVRLEYNEALFEAGTAGTLVARYLRLLAGAVSAPQTGLWRLPLLDPAERDQLDRWQAADGQRVLDRVGQSVPVQVVGRRPTGELARRRPDGNVELLGPPEHRVLLPAPVPVGAPPAAEASAPAGPSTPTERAVAEIWAEVLGLPADRVDDDFYDVGGHSMLAVRLVARLRTLTAGGRTQVGVMDVVDRRTIRRLAALIDSGASGDAGQPRGLLHELTEPVNADERVVSYVCVPYGGGSAVVYQPLADALPPGHALYSLAIPGHDVGLDEPALPFATLVERIAQEVVDRVPGPVVVYGHCGVGGALAAALALRLAAVGRPVEALYLGGLFPTARARGVLGAALARLDRVASNRVYANWLTGMGVDLSELDPVQADRIVAHMRQDGRAAEEFFTTLLADPGPRLRAPVVAVVGERDRVTEFYQERFREWHLISDTVAVAVIDEAGHYFLSHRADELADILTRSQPAIALAAADPASSAEAPATAAEPSNVTAGMVGAAAGWRLHAVHSEPSGPAAVPRNDAAPAPSLRTYLAVAAGQLVSLTGAALTQWAIPVWIYLQTGSYVSFALFAALGIVPTLLVSPLAGAIVDRLDRRRVMLAGAGAAGAAELALGILFWTGQLQTWHLYVLVVCLTTAAAFQRIGFFAATPQLVPKAYLGHANGVNQLANGFANLVVPLLAAGLLGALGLGGILLIDIVSYAVAIAVLAAVRFPRAMGRRRDEPLLTEVFGGLRYTWGIRGLRSLLLFFAVLNVFLGAALIMVPPLVLAFGSLAQVGQAAFAEALGAVLGALTMIVWGGPTRRRAAGILAATAAMAACYLLVGLRPELPLVAAGLFGAGLALAVTQGIYATVVQVKVPQRFHGRVFALNQMIAWSTLPLGYAVVGPLGGELLEPLMRPDGALAGSVGAVIGVGPGRGVGLLYLVLALMMLILTAVALRVPTLVHFDRDVPDAPPDDLFGVAQLRDRAEPGPLPEPTAGTRLDELVAAQARRTPGAVALICATERISYGELDARASRMALALRGRGVGPERVVALAVDRSVTMVVAALAILKAGGAYLPLDLGQPPARLAAILDRARPVLLLTDGPPPVESPSCPAVDHATLLAEPLPIEPTPDGSPPTGPTGGEPSDALAYVVFTSGSTGVPKGVLAHHRGVVNHLGFVMREHGIGAGDTVLQIAALAFDASVRDLFGPLTVGARVVLLTPRQARDPAAMLALVRRHRVTCLLSVVPTLLRGLADLSVGTAPSVRLVLFAGERLHPGDCVTARRIFGPRVRLVNQYGPTECTMTTTYFALPPGAAVPDSLPVGRPISGARVLILDPTGQPVPDGTLGEIYLGGVGVARGYLRAPAETAARFVPDPTAQRSGDRIYRTGDRGRLRPDGVLEFHGRIDDQVKIRGQRVEPGEIEAVLRRHPAVREAVVLAYGETPRLVAHLTGSGIDPDEVRAYLRERLPDYLVPARLSVLDALPRTPNGKVDRRALAQSRLADSAVR
jgi:amino acid adenylation domain-containing protein